MIHLNTISITYWHINYDSDGIRVPCKKPFQLLNTQRMIYTLDLVREKLFRDFSLNVINRSEILSNLRFLCSIQFHILRTNLNFWKYLFKATSIFPISLDTYQAISCFSLPVIRNVSCVSITDYICQFSVYSSTDIYIGYIELPIFANFKKRKFNFCSSKFLFHFSSACYGKRNSIFVFHVGTH